jgi:hypothetical protein
VLTVTAYAGDGAVLLAFDLAPGANNANLENLAGFAVQCTPPEGGLPSYLPNRLSFQQHLTSETSPEDRQWTPSDQAPFQKFRWVDFSGGAKPGTYRYDVTAMYFAGTGKPLRRGASAHVEIAIANFKEGALEIGFTRSYVSSQAYVQRYGNRPVRPDNTKTLDYTAQQLAEYKDEWQWLGAHGGQIVSQFMKRCLETPNTRISVFAYDLDEPTFVAELQQLGKRVQLFLDNSKLHTEKTALENEVEARVKKSAGATQVHRDHFARFAHDKIVILRRDSGEGIAVLTGSANFSVRGLYVQANNVIVFDDPEVATSYAKMFDAVWTLAKKNEGVSLAKAFEDTNFSTSWFDLAGTSLPAGTRAAFSPHKDSKFSLQPVADAITNATGSVLFAVMELQGSGVVMDAIHALPQQQKVFYYGVTQNESHADVTAFGGSAGAGVVTPFAYLKEKVPAPFRQEFSGGAGQVIHHKFVVTDFNGSNPHVFTGSSNLAKGGEESNGDNLIEFTDPDVAIIYGVEAIRLVDHFHFRSVWQQATTHQPLVLQGPSPAKGKEWWAGFYDRNNPKFREREMLRLVPAASA